MADVWKENILEDLEVRILEYETVGEFLMDIRKEFKGGDKESTKIAELKRLEQGGRIMEEYIQEFKSIKIKESRLSFFYFLSHFYFLFYLFFIVSIFRTLGIGEEVIGYTVTSVTSDSMVTTLIMELKRRK